MRQSVNSVHIWTCGNRASRRVLRNRDITEWFSLLRAHRIYSDRACLMQALIGKKKSHHRHVLDLLLCVFGFLIFSDYRRWKVRKFRPWTRLRRTKPGYPERKLCSFRNEKRQRAKQVRSKEDIEEDWDAIVLLRLFFR